MSSSPRGHAVVITMTKGRPGADVDENNIAELFQQLSFIVIRHKDKTKKVELVSFFFGEGCCVLGSDFSKV